MPQVEKSVLVPYSAEQMYALVDNVEEYPGFLPWCGGASAVAVDARTLRATVHIHYHAIRQSFTTINTRDAPQRISMKLLEGPFRYLEGDWYFIPLSATACKIAFNLRYEFSSKILEKLSGPVFHHIANSLVDAFVHQADRVYTEK